MRFLQIRIEQYIFLPIVCSYISFEFVKKQNLCLNCLVSGHTVPTCKASKCCVCSKPYHALLHRYTIPVQSEVTSLQATMSDVHLGHVTNNDEIVLATAIVNVKDRFGQLHPARALLDSGSQINLMSESLAQMLRLKREPTSLVISMVGGATIGSKNKICTSLQSRINSHNFSADC